MLFVPDISINDAGQCVDIILLSIENVNGAGQCIDIILFSVENVGLTIELLTQPTGLIIFSRFWLRYKLCLH